MSRQLNKLKQKAVENASEPGLYNDGHGLYLRVTPTKTKNWVFRFSKNGQLQDMGLGSLHDVGLAQAREEARLCRLMVKEGKDPREVRKEARIQQQLRDAKAISFAECSRLYIEAHSAGWKNAKHKAQWTNTLATYCEPINPLPVPSVDMGLVLKCLEPIWSKKPETASRVRSRIEAVLDWARVRGYRTGENPARWRGHLDKVLPRLSRKDLVQHHPALPYSKMYGFMDGLRKREGVSARCLELTILAASRTNESVAAKPAEFDLGAAVWTIPGNRTKTKRPHRVPLSPRAVEIAREAIQDAAKVGREFLFPAQEQKRKNAKPGKPKHLSNMAMLKLLDLMDYPEITVHGFRSTFKDWAAETTAYPNELSEMALAHVIGDKTEEAYRRGDLFDKRRAMMRDWEKFIATPPAKGKVVSIRKAS